MIKQAIYKKAVVALIQFDNTDVIRTSGGCESYSNLSGTSCTGGLTSTTGQDQNWDSDWENPGVDWPDEWGP